MSFDFFKGDVFRVNHVEKSVEWFWRFKWARDMFNLAFVGEIFQLFGKTTSEKFITFKIYGWRLFITPSLFNKSFYFWSKVTNFFIIFLTNERASIWAW